MQRYRIEMRELADGGVLVWVPDCPGLSFWATSIDAAKQDAPHQIRRWLDSTHGKLITRHVDVPDSR